MESVDDEVCIERETFSDDLACDDILRLSLKSFQVKATEFRQNQTFDVVNASLSSSPCSFL